MALTKLELQSWNQALEQKLHDKEQELADYKRAAAEEIADVVQTANTCCSTVIRANAGVAEQRDEAERKLEILLSVLVDWDDGIPYCRLCKYAIDSHRGQALVGRCSPHCQLALINAELGL